MTTVADALVGTPAVRTPRRVAVMPAYNEAPTIISVLERLEPLADQLIVVDDGSTDGTRDLLMNWVSTRSSVRLLCFSQNRGMSAAYYRAFQEIAQYRVTGLLADDDVILTVDADGQHDPAEVDALVDHMTRNRLDAVIAKRDFSLYTRYKRLGNFLISLWASFWAGQRLFDVESGYRAFRVGALLAALRYYKGYKYSETVEVAVILARLGFRVDNSYLVPVPVFRSRTRLKDVAIDVAAIPAAAWRLEARRGAPPGLSANLAYVLPLILPIALALMAANVLVHGLFLANDSMEHYSHIWYLWQQLLLHARLPLHFSYVDSGHGMTFPYGFVPYLAGAGLYQIFGDWAVTLLMVTGTLAMVWAAGLARPALRNPWFALIFVANPLFIDALYSFQFASVWSTVFFFLFVWAFEKQKLPMAAVLCWLTASSHPLMGSFSIAGYCLYLVLFDRRRLRPLLGVCGLTAPLLAPIFWMTLQTPSVGEQSHLQTALGVLDTVARRGTISFLPFVLGLPTAGAFVRQHYARVVGVMGVLLVLGLGFSLGVVRIADLNRGGYFGATHSTSDVYASFFDSPAFVPGAVYRVMEPTEREDGAYRFIRHGGVLANDFFGESYQRRNWTEAQFACYASAKSIEFDVIEASYTRRYRKNEASLLQALAAQGKAAVSYEDPAGRFTVYDIRPLTSRTQPPDSISDCGLS